MKKHVVSLVLAIVLIVTTLIVCASFVGAEDSYIDLTTLTLKSHSVGYGTLCVNKDLNGGKINIQNADGGETSFEKGFVAHATSELVFDVSKYTSTASVFSVYIGADKNPSNATTASTSMIFSIKADNKELFKSGVITYNTPVELVQVAVPAGTKTLTMIADADGSNYGDHSAWAEPRLYGNSSMLEEFKSATLTTPANVLKIGEKQKLSYSFVNLAEKPLTPDTLTFTSSDPSVLKVSSSGEMQGIKKGDVVVTMKGSKNGTEFEKSVNITVIGTIVEKSFTLRSPNGDLTMNMNLDSQGVLHYTVTAKDGSPVVLDSIIGINTAPCNFSYALEYNTASEVRSVSETYTVYSGKHSTVENIYNEMVVSFKRSSYSFDVYFRGYDEGFAYRFAIRRQDGKEEKLPVVEETGTFVIPAKSNIYAQFLCPQQIRT